VLLRLRVANVRSLRDEQELSFVAADNESGRVVRGLTLIRK
jgi:hypothetical protein